MKQIIVLVSIVLSLNSYSQQFNGVPIKGSINSVIEQFKSKGYKLRKFTELGAIMDGQILSQPIELFIVYTPKSKQVFKITVYLKEHNTWSSLYNHYENTVNTFIDKYGISDYKTEKFDYPYELGDGHEITAVQMEKCKYNHLWLDKNNTHIMVEITEFKQVRISYENAILSQLKDKEVEQINSNIF
jgi:hypothetical protein